MIRPSSIAVLLALLALIVPLLPPRDAFPQPQLPPTPAGERVSAHIAAFNAGEEEMRTFVKTWWAAEGLRSVPLEMRMERYRQMRQDLGTIRLHRVESANDSSLSAIVRSEQGEWLEFRFGFENSPRHAITRISVQEADDPNMPTPAPAASAADLLRRTSSYVDSLTALDQFSGTVMIAKEDTVLFLKAYGFADRAKKIPNRIDTRFNVGSINKIFTRIAILQLESEGKLSLTDTVGRFLPDYPNAEAARTVTIRHLLDMSSGIGDFFGDRYDAADKERITGLKEYLPLFADKPLEFAPGTARRYSNGGFIVLGLIIERVSGVDYYDYVRQRVYAPAGMTTAGSFRKSALPPNTALGYSTVQKTSNFSTLPGIGSSAGGGYCSADDLFRFVRSLTKGVLHLPDLGSGLGIAGGAPGLNSALEWDRSTGYLIIVLCNFDPPHATRLAGHIRRLTPRR